VIILKWAMKPLGKEEMKSEFIWKVLFPCFIVSWLCEEEPLLDLGRGHAFAQLNLLLELTRAHNVMKKFTFNKYKFFMRKISQIAHRLYTDNIIEENDIKILRRIYYELLRLPRLYERLAEYYQAMIDNFDPLRVFCLSVIDTLFYYLEKEYPGILTGRCKYCGNIFIQTGQEKTHCKPYDIGYDCEKKEKNDLGRCKRNVMLDARALLLNT
jgi:hypothetical protein